MKFVSILLTILAIIGLIAVVLGIFVFRANHLMFLGFFVSASATASIWLVNKRYLSENKQAKK